VVFDVGGEDCDMGLIGRLLLAALLVLEPVCAFAQNTKAQMTTEINTNFPDNTTGLITPAITRTTTNDMNTAWQQAPRIRTVLATTDTILLADYGQMVVYNQVNPVAVTLPQATTTFATFNFLAKNIGTGLVTITPTTSTINGAATMTLQTGQIAWIMSDGTNYQVHVSPFLAGQSLSLAGNQAFTGNGSFILGVYGPVQVPSSSVSAAVLSMQFTTSGDRGQTSYQGFFDQSNTTAGQGGNWYAGSFLSSTTSTWTPAASGISGPIGLQAGGSTTRGGFAFGMNPYCQVLTLAATSCVGTEIDIDSRVNGTVNKIGLQVVDLNTSTGTGATINTAVLIGAMSGAALFANGFQIIPGNGVFPITAGGTAFQVSGGTLTNAFDASGATVTGCNFNMAAGCLDPVLTAWTAFTPSAACGTATITSTGRRKTLGKTTFVEIDFTITALGTCTNVMTYTMPTTPQARGALVGSETANSNVIVSCSYVAGNATSNCIKNAAANFAVNDRVSAQGVYENQ
jgi:hypothetical protein